jgi:hypothetical protein
MRIKLNESEKNRIKSLHKNYSIIKEQDNCPPSDTTSPFYTNPGEFCINCGPGAYYFNHNDCPCCDGDNQVGMEPCKDPNSPFNTNLPEFCYVQNGVYHHQQPGASYHNHPDADCCGPIVDDDGDVLDLDDESYENEVGVSMIGSGSGFKDKQGNSDRLEKFNRNNIDLKAKPSSGGNFRMGESDLRRQTRHKGKSKVIVNLTETELISYINKSIINEQQNPCIDPSTIDPQYQPLGVACLCSLNVGWSNGNQYGGTIELDGCMPPNGSVFRIYVNDNFAAQGSSLSFSANIPWQGQQTSIIKVKTVLECTGQHPACSEETIEKSICVERSTGNKVSCGKRLPDNPLKGDKTKSVYNPDGGSQLDIDSLNKKGSMTNYKPSQSSHSSYGKETTNLRESDLIRLIRRAVNEQQATSWNCEDGKCVKVVGKGGVGDFATLQECEDSNCEERARPTGTGVRKHDRDMAKRRPYSPKYRDMRGSRNESVRRQKLYEGPICGAKSGEACGEACGDGYTWQDSNASNSCICNHSNGKVCNTTGPQMTGGYVKGLDKGTKTPYKPGNNKGWQHIDTSKF